MLQRQWEESQKRLDVLAADGEATEEVPFCYHYQVIGHHQYDHHCHHLSSLDADNCCSLSAAVTPCWLSALSCDTCA